MRQENPRVTEGNPHPSGWGEVDRIYEANKTGLYWVGVPQDGVWALYQFDDMTGSLGHLGHLSSNSMDIAQATAWASDLVGVSSWRSWDDCFPGSFVEEIFFLVRAVGRTPRVGRRLVLRMAPDLHNASLDFVTVRERYLSGLESDILYTCARSSFTSDTELFQWASDRWRVSRWLPFGDSAFIEAVESPA